MSDSETSPRRERATKSEASLDVVPQQHRGKTHSTPLENSSSSPVIDGKARKKRKKNCNLGAKLFPSAIGHALTMFQSSHKKKNEDFHAICKEVPESEVLIDDYACALQKEILLQGRLYVTVESAYFYSNLLVYETRLKIKWVDVTAINKSRTALVFPNAVEIHTQTNTKYGFSTLLSRDTTHTVLFKVWQNALMGKPQLGPELVRFARQMWRDDSQTGLTSEDSEPENIPPPPQSTSSVPKHSQNLRHQLHQVHMKGNNNKDEQTNKREVDTGNSTSAVEDTQKSQDDTEETISPQDIPATDGKQLINEEFQFPVETMFTMLFSESPFYTALRKEQKDSNIRDGEWVTGTEDEAMKIRQIKYVVALNYSIGPKSAETEEQQTMKTGSKPRLLYHIVCEFVTRHIPYADSFFVANQYCLWKVAPNRTHLRLSVSVKFKKSVWGVKSKFSRSKNYTHDGMKYLFFTCKTTCPQQTRDMSVTRGKARGSGMIERNALKGVTDFSKRLIRNLRSAETSSAGSIARPYKSNGPRVAASYRRRQSMAKSTRRQSTRTLRSTSNSDSTASESRESTESIARQYLYWIIALSVLLVLFGFNIFLYSRLSTFQASLMAVEKSSIDSGTHLGRQQYFYMMELDRWKAIATMSVDVLSKCTKRCISPIHSQRDASLQYKSANLRDASLQYINASIMAIEQQIGNQLREDEVK